VDELLLENVTVSADAGSWSVGASDGDASNVTSCASTVGTITMIGTIIEGAVGSSDNAVCVSEISNVNMINSTLHGSGFGGQIEKLRLESSKVECSKASEEFCVEVSSLFLAGRITGKTNTRRFFKVGMIVHEDHPMMIVRYFGDSDPEGFTQWPSVHFRAISPPFTGPYEVFRGLSRDYVIEMEGPEKGLFFPIDPGRSVVGFRIPLEGFVGRMITSDYIHLNIGEGETIVDNPSFVSFTLRFTSAISPYMVRRILVKIAEFVFFWMGRSPMISPSSCFKAG
jgi:hypothetical protein